MARTRVTVTLFGVAVLLLLLPCRLCGTHSEVLPCTGSWQEALIWDGPAVAQMIMASYPSGATSCTPIQTDIWTSIQAHQTNASWAADPDGLKGALNSLCPPTHGWSIFHNASAPSLMYGMAYWMTALEYPVAVLLDTQPGCTFSGGGQHTEHWVVATGYVANCKPTEAGCTSPLTIHWVEIIDPVNPSSPCTLPLPVPLPAKQMISGAQWYGTGSYAPLFNPVTAATKPTGPYIGEYVAIVEPPQFPGLAVPRLQAVSGALIGPETAVERAIDSIRSGELAEVLERSRAYDAILRGSPRGAILVNRERGAYYVVPFEEPDVRGGATGAVLVNAYDGSLQALTTFGAVPYVDERKAIEQAAQRAGGELDPRSATAVLVAPVDAGPSVRYFPAWEVFDTDTVAWVLPDGVVLDEPPGELPHVSTSTVVLGNVYEPLFALDQDGGLMPGLVQAWEIDEKGELITLYLREDVPFHDGTELSAEHVMWNLSRSPDGVPSLDRIPFLEYEAVAEVGVVDEHTLQIRLHEIDPAVLFRLAGIEGWILHPDVDPYTEYPAGTGPLRIVQAAPGWEYVTERFEAYWRGGVKFPGAVFRVYDRIDAAFDDLKSLEVDVLFGGDGRTFVAANDEPELRVCGPPHSFVAYREDLRRLPCRPDGSVAFGDVATERYLVVAVPPF